MYDNIHYKLKKKKKKFKKKKKKKSPLIEGGKKKDKYVSTAPLITSSASRFLDRRERLSKNRHWTKKEP